MGSSCNLKRRLTGVFAGIVLVLGLACGPVLAQACRENSVNIRGDWGSARFSVEIADDAEERARGLMFRESMPKAAGMLFVYPAPQRVSFWMKNTLLALDLIFVDAFGEIRSIHENAIPGDLTSIDGGFDIKAVLEVNAGLSKSMGLTPGDQMRHPVFGATALWPC
ncbi:MAG: uncharacterized membrane protein (UPF0127 family) [Paracoccaceae bacterium]|jgi:uncharacterized membrane protein (UPF0127 family)